MRLITVTMLGLGLMSGQAMADLNSRTGAGAGVGLGLGLGNLVQLDAEAGARVNQELDTRRDDRRAAPQGRVDTGAQVTGQARTSTPQRGGLLNGLLGL
ncbi:hypothetical protein RM531_10395 [Salinisphaera sp. P385]|uniref:Uncharacterized protein n=1 Tax=Spectribacter acetivorans TaxID=3075603 RepID=A0ABU3BC90_9GAMM|nr:hypothetical protein [Salinisphaera sp. P385]MDT0618883.1 hypothetical protein [Salinisphaera sp. P385]